MQFTSPELLMPWYVTSSDPTTTSLKIHIIYKMGFEPFYPGFETRFAPRTSGYWDAKHLLNHNIGAI